MVFSGLHSVIETIISQLSQFIQCFASFYLHFVAIGCHIITKGFVNPIPDFKEENNFTGKDERIEGAGEATGMGDGDASCAANDVGDQIENMEQIEGLKVNRNRPTFLL